MGIPFTMSGYREWTEMTGRDETENAAARTAAYDGIRRKRGVVVMLGGEEKPQLYV
jgi:hypothetical protein